MCLPKPVVCECGHPHHKSLTICPMCEKPIANPQTEQAEASSLSDLLAALNEMWSEEMSKCCRLPCTDSICREDMSDEGGCLGADFADKLMEFTGS